jgi:exosome complex RNA-binding protein Rrp42 (RNase PH superfamily)
MPRKQTGISITKGDVVDEATGEVHERVFVDYDPKKHKAFFTDLEYGRPKKRREFFVMMTRSILLDHTLTHEELGIFSRMCGLVGWENNYIQKDGEYLNISQLAVYLKLQRRKLKHVLDTFEEKGIITYQGHSREKYIQVSTKYVWFGKEKSRTD